MLGLLRDGQTLVHRLRLRRPGGRAHDAHERARFSLALMAAALRPPAFPPSAILCVRRLSDPMPGRLGASGGVRAAPEWELAVQNELARLWHTAARPMIESVAPNADAVLFADSSELLACLAADWSDGLFHTRWWWPAAGVTAREAFAGRSPFARAWLAQAECVPSALARLAAARRVVRTVAALPDDEAREVMTAVASRFGLPSDRGSGGDASLRGPLIDRDTTDYRAEIGRGDHGRPAWEAFVSEATDASLGAPQRRLVAIGLLLHRAPSVAREPGVPASIAAWDPTRGRRRTTESVPARPGTTALAPPSHPEATGTTLTEPDDAVARVSRSSAIPNAPFGRSAPVARSTARGLVTTEHTVPSRGVGPPGHLDPLLPLGDGDRASEHPTWSVQHEAALETAYGGVFYLVNAALALGLYGDFTAPTHRGLAMPVWDFLTLTGRALAGDAFDADPLPLLFARLAGRVAGERAGARFQSDGGWRIPAAWLAPFPERVGWTWMARRGRLSVWHPAGFAVVDVQLTGDTVAHQLAAELATLGIGDVVVTRRRHPRIDQRGSPFACWMRRLVPYLHARLGRALGSTGADDVAKLVCARAARVQVTAARVDVHFALADLPIAIRLAGLDRDPGWVPAAGRSIAFHYD